MNLDYQAASAAAQAAARAVAPELRSGFGNAASAEYSGANAGDVVTEHDRVATARLAELLGSFDSSVGFYGEDVSGDMPNGTFWMVDAIGGTGHFIRGTLFASTMISLIDEGRPVAAVIHDFVGDRCFHAAKGSGSWCDEQQLQVSSRPLNKAYLCAEIDCGRPRNALVMGRLQAAAPVVSVANYGWEFTMTASGFFDGCITMDPWGGPWDFAPGALLVAEAGGVVLSLGETKYDFTNLDVIAAPPQIVEALTTGEDPVISPATES